MYILTVEESFASAHQLRGYQGKCENLHGHTWRVAASVSGLVLNGIGLLIDFNDLKDMLRSIVKELDHANLNAIPPFDSVNPSSENIARYIAERLSGEITRLQGPGNAVESVTVWESESSRCTYVLPRKGEQARPDHGDHR